MDILISAKQNKAGIAAARKLERRFKGIANVHFDLSTALRLRKHGHAIKNFKGDLIITLGGDGTFLWTAYQAQIPILPVRIEGHGFLCTAELKDVIANLQAIKSQKYEVFKRMRLKCTSTKSRTVKTKIRQIFTGKDYPPAVNEIAFARKRPSKVLALEFSVDGTPLEFSGDGILFATPAGSTAYNASAGGPLIDQGLDVLTLVPLYPFHSAIKPIVLPASKPVDVRVLSGDCALIIDGHTGEYVKAGGTFRVERGEPVHVVRLRPANFYARYKASFLEGRGRPE
jgi:NAD+ kinase